MNKDDHCSLSLQDRFSLFLSDPAIERELINVKKPTISVEPLPSSIYYKSPQKKSTQQKKKEAEVKEQPAREASGNRRTKKQEAKKVQKTDKLGQVIEVPPQIIKPQIQPQPDRNDDDLGNEKLSELMRCAACLSVPIYPKECRHCTKIVCETCLARYDRSGTKKNNGVVCFLCKSEDPEAYQPIQSKLLSDIIDRIKVGHRCTRFQEIQVYTVAELRRHAESGECPGYHYKCFCGSQYKYSYEEIRKHLREECKMVRLQCRYCQDSHDYPAGGLDMAQMNHFNDHSMTREQFRSHPCYLDQKKVDDSLAAPDTLAKIKMLLLNKNHDLMARSKLGSKIAQAQSGIASNKQKQSLTKEEIVDSNCKNDKCLTGWFDEPAPRYINQVQLEIFNVKKNREENTENYECQRCHKDYEYLYPTPSCLSKKQDVLVRCSKCCLATCKFCLQQEEGLPADIEEDNGILTSNELTLQTILNLLNIKFERNIKDEADPYNSVVNVLTAQRQQQQQQTTQQILRSSLENDNEEVVDTHTEQMQIIEGVDSMVSGSNEEDGQDMHNTSHMFQSQVRANERANNGGQMIR